jgi:nitrogen fixation NifU-like protein
VAEAGVIFDRFHELVTGDRVADLDDEVLGKLAVFGGVREFPVRVKCASLAWHTLKSALSGSPDVARTE